MLDITPLEASANYLMVHLPELNTLVKKSEMLANVISFGKRKYE